jgi:predicted nucleic acid-binding protein
VVFNDAEQDETIRSKIKNLCSASYTGTKLGPYMDALLKATCKKYNRQKLVSLDETKFQVAINNENFEDFKRQNSYPIIQSRKSRVS